MRSKKYVQWPAVMILAVIMMGSVPSAWAAFGEDPEKPKPEFTRKGEDINARLIPRGKSLSVLIHFRAAGAALNEVEVADFAEGEEPDVDLKDFRSGFFKMRLVTPTPGAEAHLTISSAYFNSSTQLWGGNPKQKASWKDCRADNKSLPDRVNELTITVQDGGSLDADGAVNGKIEIYTGPHDSFWGYAIGTLFIRFFGVFIVLGVLQLGMLISGAVFQRLESRNQQTAAASIPAEILSEKEPVPGFRIEEHQTPPAIDPGVSGEVAAAIALALHLHGESQNRQQSVGAKPQTTGPSQAGPSPWSMFGRGALMADRLRTFDRIHFQPARTSK